MEYERIHRPLFPQGGGFSPKKLREKLLRVEKRRNEEEEKESKASLRSEDSEFESGRASEADSCKDVECSISMEFTGSHRRRDLAIGAARIDSLESDSLATGFQFQKAERTPLPSHRSTMGTTTLAPPFSKPSPSKWDDAQKWIARPKPNRGGNKGDRGGEQTKKGGLAGHITREVAAMVVLDVSESHVKKEVDSGAKPAVVFENPVINSDADRSWHDLSASDLSTTIFVTAATAIRAVSMRDTGTEMTPAASQEPSRAGTPIRATSPSTSPPFPRRSIAQRTAPCSTQTHSSAGNKEQSIQEMSEEEQRRKTRREIMVLGQQLGKTNIVAWASQEEEEMDAEVSTMSKDHSAESVTVARAVAWEEAEKTKYLARFKREQIKIAAWENHQKATIEAEMRKVEVEVERTRAYGQERLMNQLTAVRHKAEAKRAAAEAKREQRAVKTAGQVDYIRRTGSSRTERIRARETADGSHVNALWPLMPKQNNTSEF